MNIVPLPGSFIQIIFQPGNKLIIAGSLRFWLPRRWHHAAAQFTNRRFPDIGIVRHTVNTHQGEIHTAGIIDGVMALRAVFVQKFPLSGRLQCGKFVDILRLSADSKHATRHHEQCRCTKAEFSSVIHKAALVFLFLFVFVPVIIKGKPCIFQYL